MPPPRIAFLHPDLGIGGAERLVVDAAVGLQNMGHKVAIFTSHCDKSHCFEEVSSNVLAVKVYGDFLPTHVFQKLHILFAIIRQFYLVMRMVLSDEINDYDYFIVDQLSFAVPLLNFFTDTETRVLFYCHFPDQLLAKKGGLLKKLYRIPFNLVEEWTTGMSDKIVVNSSYTKGIFHDTFTHLSKIDPAVIYPCVDVESARVLSEKDKESDTELETFLNGSPFFVSVNRFERIKNVDLAIKAFAKFKQSLPETGPKPRLVIAGGFDPRVIENVEYLAELSLLAEELGLKNFTIRGKLIVMPPATDVLFMPSVNSSLKNALIRNAELLLYTSPFEHFGIVPVESMLYKTPVLAVNRAGPLESIINYTGSNILEATGYTKPPKEDVWAETLTEYYFDLDKKVKVQMGENGHRRATEVFSREHMSKEFLLNLLESSKTNVPKGYVYLLIRVLTLPVLMLLVALVMYPFFD